MAELRWTPMSNYFLIANEAAAGTAIRDLLHGDALDFDFNAPTTAVQKC